MAQWYSTIRTAAKNDALDSLRLVFSSIATTLTLISDLDLLSPALNHSLDIIVKSGTVLKN